MNVYILAPVDKMSGGPELAHQLCHAINTNTDSKAFMCYVNVFAPFSEALCAKAVAPEPFRVYGTEPVFSMEEMDRKGNVVVFPEGLTLSMPYVKNAAKVMWWMSVDNYILSTDEENLDDIAKTVDLHLYQSNYAKDYVEKKIPGANGMYLSDYINEEHGKFLYPAEFRQNAALYNPAKGYDILKHIQEKISWLKWIPIIGLELPQIILLMQSSKIYVDFGNHPGKDRIPREAAANGCCVITNRKGSAAYDTDVPIPPSYKFDRPEEEADSIDALLHDICDNFKAHQDKFEAYRSFIRGEKEKFNADTILFLEKISRGL